MQPSPSTLDLSVHIGFNAVDEMSAADKNPRAVSQGQHTGSVVVNLKGTPLFFAGKNKIQSYFDRD